jgi:hypothetical protein
MLRRLGQMEHLSGEAAATPAASAAGAGNKWGFGLTTPAVVLDERDRGRNF